MKTNTAVKILAIALSVCMLLTAVPLSGFIGLKLPELKLPESFKAALANITGYVADIGNDASAATVASGFCGADEDNLTWTLDDAGLLTIEGSGDMIDWYTSGAAPWYSYSSSIKQLQIGGGVTSIGDFAFNSLRAMTEIDLSACTELSSIGSYAFQGCSKLTEIDLSACTKLSSIGNYTFRYCLAEIKIGSDVCSIRYYAETIDENMAILCNAGSSAQAYARQYNRPYKALDGHTHELSETAVAPSCSLPGYTAHICSVCSKTVYIDNVTPATGHTDSDADGVCDSCSSAYVEITASGACGETLVWSLDGNGLLTIEGNGAIGTWLSNSNAPWYSYSSQIKQVQIGSGISSIRSRVFENNSMLTAISFASDNPYFASADGVVFNKAMTELICYPQGKTDITYTVPSSVTEIHDYAFPNSSYLKEIDLSGCTSLSTIGVFAFATCSNLTDISIADDNPYFTDLGGVLFNKAMTDLIYYPGGKTDISYTIPASVTRICHYAFYYHTKLKEIDFSVCTGLKLIGSSAFSYSSITGLNLSGHTELLFIGQGAFQQCEALKTVDLSGCTALTNIGYNMAFYCSALTEINLSGCTALSSIGHRAFSNCNLINLDLSPCTALTEIRIRAFEECPALTTVDLSGLTAMTSIGSSTFDGCTSLTEIDLSGCTAMTEIGSTTFEECTSLTEIDLSPCTALTSIGTYTFRDCTSLTEIDLSGCTALTEIGTRTFNGCTSLTEIDLSPCTALTSIGYYTFDDLSSLTEIDLSGLTALTDIGSYTFNGCTSLTEIDLSGCTKLSTIDSDDFYGCTSIANIQIGNASCRITDSANTIPSGATIHGSSCSTAKAYATKYERNFIAFPGEPEHVPGNLVIKTAATCSTTGLKTRSCTRCLEVIETQEIPTTNHTVVTDAAVAATCTATGLTAGKHCSVCNTVITAQTETPVLDHTWDAGVITTAPTCSAAGVKTFTCTVCSTTKTEDIPALDHTWDAGVITTAPTCTETGVKTFTCTLCSTTTTETIAANGHSFGEWYTVTEASCGVTGQERRDCSVCDHFETRDIAALEHNYIGVVTAPTCTAGGYTTYTCSNCGDSYTDDATTALGHAYDIVVTAPTCTEGGYTTYTCSNCGDSYTADATTALGHDWDAGTVTTASTCTEAGVKTFACSRCTDTKTEAVSATGHTVVNDAAVEPTCTTTGLTAGTHCSVCHAIITAQIEIAVLGHDWDAGTVTTAPTCTEEGVKTFDCSRCTDTKTEAVSALGHDTVTHEAQAATCTEIGWDAYDTCSRCDYTTYEEIAALGHNYTSAVTAPSCTDGGYTTYTCSNCGDSYTADETAALGHDYTSAVTAPTCTDGGYTTYTCSNCGDSYIADATAALGHAYTSAVTAPTCTEGGYTTYTCSNCGDSYTDDATAALGHAYTSAVTAPTCTEGGYTTYTCSNCGDSYTADETAALGHTEETIPAVAPTCTETGLTDGVKCSVCEEIITAQLVIAALGHHWSEGTITTAPTCTEAGVMTFVCTECSASKTGEIAATGHTVVTDAAVAATCTETGLTEGSHCSECGEILTAQTVVDMLDHAWDEWNTVTESTCTSEGERSHTCTNCGKTETETISTTAHYDTDEDSRCDSCGKALSDECFWTTLMRVIRTLICSFIKSYFPCCSCDCIRALCKDCP